MALIFYRIGNWCYRNKIPLVPRFMTLMGRLVLGCHIDSKARIGRDVKLAYGGSGVVIHGSAVIGQNCLISPGVVIGGRSGKAAAQLGDSVKVYSNAAILGDVKIGTGSIIGSNVVVTESVKPFAVLVAQKPRYLEK